MCGWFYDGFIPVFEGLDWHSAHLSLCGHHMPNGDGVHFRHFSEDALGSGFKNVKWTPRALNVCIFKSSVSCVLCPR